MPAQYAAGYNITLGHWASQLRAITPYLNDHLSRSQPLIIMRLCPHSLQ